MSSSSSEFGSVEPRRWGRAAWDTMHWVAAAYPEEPDAGQQMDARRFFLGLSRVLPCPECQKHFAEILETNPIDEALKSGASLRRWVLDVHNAVNSRLGAPTLKPEQIQSKFSLDTTTGNGTAASGSKYVVVDNVALYQHRMLQRGIAFTGRVQQPSKAMLRGIVPTNGTLVVRRGVAGAARGNVKRTVTQTAPKKPRKRGCGCGAR